MSTVISQHKFNKPATCSTVTGLSLSAAFRPLLRLSVTCPWSVCSFSMACLQRVHGLSAACQWPVCSMSMACLQPIHGLSAACPWRAGGDMSSLATDGRITRVIRSSSKARVRGALDLFLTLWRWYTYVHIYPPCFTKLLSDVIVAPSRWESIHTSQYTAHAHIYQLLLLPPGVSLSLFLRKL